MKQKIAKAILWFFGFLVVSYFVAYIIALVVSSGGPVFVGVLIAAALILVVGGLCWALDNV